MKEEIKNALITLHEMGIEAEDSILYLQTALIYNTSTLYINILDSIKGIAWHAKAIATKLA